MQTIRDVPAALLLAAVMVPPTGPPTEGGLEAEPASGTMDALVQGTLRGLDLLLQIVALLVVVVALVALIPERRREVVELGPRAVVAGTLATLMTGAVVGLLDTAGLA